MVVVRVNPEADDRKSNCHNGYGTSTYVRKDDHAEAMARHDDSNDNRT